MIVKFVKLINLKNNTLNVYNCITIKHNEFTYLVISKYFSRSYLTIIGLYIILKTIDKTLQNDSASVEEMRYFSIQCRCFYCPGACSCVLILVY